MRAALVVLTLLVAAPAGAQTIRDFAERANFQKFQICRAAVFYHLDDQTRGDTKLPLSFVRTLNAQISFVMQEALLRRLVGSVEEGAAVVSTTEAWFIDFTRVLRDQRATLVDPAVRDKVMLDCVPFIWVTIKNDLDRLLALRQRVSGQQPEPDGGAALQEMDREYQSLVE